MTVEVDLEAATRRARVVYLSADRGRAGGRRGGDDDDHNERARILSLWAKYSCEMTTSVTSSNAARSKRQASTILQGGGKKKIKKFGHGHSAWLVAVDQTELGQSRL